MDKGKLVFCAGCKELMAVHIDAHDGKVWAWCGCD